MRHILQLGDVRDKLLSMGLDTAGLNDAAYGQYIRAEMLKYGKLVKSANVTIQ